MNKTNVIVFASISAISFCYILFFDKNKGRRKKLSKEIAEAIKKLDNETAEVIKKLSNGDLVGNDSTEK